jgi:hypothetical protein
MRKLNLDTLVVDSFTTVDVPQQMRGTVEGRQEGHSLLPPFFTCWKTCGYTCDRTAPASCRETDCITACQGGSELSGAECGGGETTGAGGTGTDYIGCTNDCTTGMTAS